MLKAQYRVNFKTRFKAKEHDTKQDIKRHFKSKKLNRNENLF